MIVSFDASCGFIGRDEAADLNAPLGGCLVHSCLVPRGNFQTRRDRDRPCVLRTVAAVEADVIESSDGDTVAWVRLRARITPYDANR